MADQHKPHKTFADLSGFGRVSKSCSTCVTCRVINASTYPIIYKITLLSEDTNN